MVTVAYRMKKQVFILSFFFNFIKNLIETNVKIKNCDTF